MALDCRLVSVQRDFEERLRFVISLLAWHRGPPAAPDNGQLSGPFHK
jgi:hypothetical protein